MAATSGARIPITTMPRATWRLPVIGASSRNTVAPLVDGSHLDLVGCGDRGLEERGRRVERGETWNAARDGGTADLETIFEDWAAVARVVVDVGHSVDDQLHLTAHHHVDDVRTLAAAPRHETGGETCLAQR